MKKRLLLPTALFAATCANAQDLCSNAMIITAGTYVVSAIDGTEVPSPDCTGGAQLGTLGEWYAYTPASDGSLKVTSELQVNSGRDTRFHIYTGTCGALTCVGGDDDAGVIGNGYLSIDSLNVNGGTTYYIAWDNRWNALGFTFQIVEGPEFEIPFGFTSLSNPTEGRVLAAVDMNNDGADDVVTIDSTRIIVHQQLPEGGFNVVTYTTTEADNEPSWSLCAGDLNADGHNDLMYGGGGGVTLMLSDNAGTEFTEVSYPQYVFSQRGNMVDIDNDGHLDAFMCHDVDPNVYYINNGDGTLTYFQGGLGDNADGGNYGSIWIDYDNDRDLDLFIAKCRGGASLAAIDQMHRNNGDGTFTEVAVALGLDGGYHQSWSSAWGDYDLDGDLDVMIGASSMTFGGHRLMRNDGATFTDVTIGSGLDLFTGTTNEWTTHDFNNDGRLDILGGGALYLATGDFTFAFGVNATNHAIGDLNNDGFLDILSTGSIRLNNTNANNWLKVRTVGTVSNKNGIGARVLVTTASGTQMREIRSGDGFRYMSSLQAHFGLGQEEAVQEVRVLWPSGLTSVISDVDVNDMLTVVEGVNTSVEDGLKDLAVFPNPVAHELIINDLTDGSHPVVIHDAQGARIAERTLVGGRMNVADLAAGVYLLTTRHQGRVVIARFVKQ